MPAGSCFCGAIKFSYSDEVSRTGLCHCTSCRKVTGSTYTTNIVVPLSALTTLAGTPKTYSCTGGSGLPLVLHFCGDCSSLLWSTPGKLKGMAVIKAGCVDGSLEGARPQVEFAVENRAAWVVAVDGAVQKVGTT